MNKQNFILIAFFLVFSLNSVFGQEKAPGQTGNYDNGDAISGCLSFDGGDYLKSSATSLFDGYTNFTIEAWVNPSSGAATVYPTIVAKRSDVFPKEIAWLGYSTGTWQFELTTNLGENVYHTTSQSVVYNKWVHVALAVDITAKTAKFYLNGELRQSFNMVYSGSSLYSYSGNPVEIGAWLPPSYTHSFWLGGMDEVRIWNETRSESQIFSNMYSGIANPAGEPGLVAYYTFGEGSGQTAFDAGNTGLDMQLGSTPGVDSNDPSWGNCPIPDPANSLCFDGVNDYVTVPHHSTLNPGAASSWTVELWARLENTTTPRTIIAKRMNTGSYTQFSLYKNGADMYNLVPGKRICFLYYQNGSVTRGCYTNNDVVDGNWHHIAAVADQAANTVRIYIDGVLQPTTLASNVGAWPDPSNTAPLFLGHNNAAAYTDGSMKEVRVWKSARTQAEINQFMYSGIPNPAAEPALRAYFPCNEGTGQIINDYSANGNNGFRGSTNTFDNNDPYWCNEPLPQEGQQCLDFDGNNDYVQIANSPSLNPNNQITVEAWYKPVSFYGSGNDPIVDKAYTSHSYPYYQYHLGVTGYTYFHSPAAFNFDVAVNGTWYYLTSASYIYTPGVWYHVAGVYDGSEVKLYVNGTLAASTPASGTMTDYGKPIRMGTYSNYNSYLPGQIDEVRIWSIARTQDQLRQEMHRQLLNPTSESNLVAYYRFNQTGGSILADLSLYGNNGTLTNMDPATDWMASTAPIPYNTVASGSWETNGNWAYGQNYPFNAWARANVNHNLTLNSNKELIDLNIASTASLNVAESFTLTVSDQFTNQSGTDGLVLNSGSGGTASLIENDGVEATVERWFTGNTANWHLVSSPVTAALSGVYTGIYLQLFQETSNTYVQIVPTDVPMTPGRGYAAYSNLGASSTVAYSGNLNTGSVSFPVTNTATAPYGWNLAGNPFASSIDWNAVIPGLSGINNTIYYLESSTGNWLTWNGSTGGGSRYIPPMQAFFVSAASGSNLVLDNSHRTHNQNNLFYKDGPENLLILSASGNGLRDKTYFSFNEDATPAFDGQTDGYKIISDYNVMLPQVFTKNEDTKLSIDYRPAVPSAELGFTAGTEGIYTIGVDENLGYTQLWLEDTKTGIYTDLKENTYPFAFSLQDGDRSFVLHFESPTRLNEGEMKVYASGNSVYLLNPGDEKAMVTLTDLSGKQLGMATAGNIGLNEVFSGLKAGIYLVKAGNTETMMVEKVIIQ